MTMPAFALPAAPVPVTFAIAAETDADVPARDQLLDRAMRPNWRRKASEKLRRGRLPAIALVARDGEGRLVGTVRLWRVEAGGRAATTSPLWGGRAKGAGGGAAADTPTPSLRSDPPHKGEDVSEGLLLLGPLAVDPSFQGGGVGSALMRAALDAATVGGHGAVLLMGDPEYYGRFGFSAEKTGALAMPGPFEKRRFLAVEFASGALDGAAGVLKAAGTRSPCVEGRKAA